MKSIRFLLTALAAAVAITCLAQGAPAFADNSGNKNETPYWVSQLGGGATCAKHNPGDTTTDGQLTDGGTSVTLDPGNWVLLVVNSGSEGPAGDGNLVYQNPVAGTAYFGPLNNGGQQGAVSHWIVCTGAPTPQPEPQVTPSSWTDDGAWLCGATTVAQTRTITTVPYVLVNGQWQLDTDPTHTTTTLEHQTRQLTANEQFACDVVVPTQSPAFVEATCTADAGLVLPETTGVTYTPSAPAAAGATVTVVATPQQGYALSGQTQWTHTYATLAAIQCLQAGPTPQADTQTGSQQGAIDTPTLTDQSASEAPAPTPTPVTELPKTGNDHVTLLALIAAVLLGGGVALSAAAARRRA